MTYPDLSNYIAAQRKQGISDAVIHDSLLAAGWQDDQIKVGFAELTPATEPSSFPGSGEETALTSLSSGATIPVFYSAAMRMWAFLALELFLYSMPLWLALVLGPILPETVRSSTVQLLAWPLTLVVSLPLMLVRSILARRQAWKTRRWQSLGHFLVVQRSWDTVGRLLLLPYLIAVIIIGFTLGMAAFTDYSSPANPVSNSTDSGQAILGNGGYVRMAQLVVEPSLSTLNGVSLTGLANTGSATVSLESHQFLARRDPAAGPLNSEEPLKTEATRLVGGSLAGTNPWAAPVNFIDNPEDPGHFFFIFELSPNSTTALTATLQEATVERPILYGSRKTSAESATSEDPFQDWEVIDDKALTLSVE